MTAPKLFLICQNRTCRKSGAAQVLAAFEAIDQQSRRVVASSCLGQCGNGPMVLALPEDIWYDRVQPEEAAAILRRHL